MPPQSTVPPLMIAPFLQELLPPELLEELLEDEDELLDEEDEELLDELLVDAAYEHQAEAGKLLDGKFELEQATLVVKVPYTNEPDLPKATWRVPLKEQVAPVFCAHLV